LAVGDQHLDGLHPVAAGDAEAGPRKSSRWWPKWLRPVYAGLRRVIGATVFSSLTRRIVFLNLAAVAVLVVGTLYLNNWRAGLIEARIQSLRIQGEIISAAIAASATVDSDVITVNPERLLELQGGNALSPLSFFDPSLEFPISPEQVAPLLRNLVTPTRTRARIYDDDGLLILDSQNLYARGEVLRRATAENAQAIPFYVDWWNALMSWVPGDQFPIYQDHEADQGKLYPEVNVALSGSSADIVRINSQGQLVISVAVPVQRLRAIIGVLLLSTEPGDIDSIVAAERWGILRIALVAAGVTSVLSMLLAGTIAGPMRRLSAAAERAGAVMHARAEIPDYTDRPDEIGHLSGSLRSMTNALYDRIEGTEQFAADVAHELKNPLTSLRSAVETLPRARSAKDRERLTAIIQHDVRRLDRLISDISNASRLDAELARGTSEHVDVREIIEAIISINSEFADRRHITVRLDISEARHPTMVQGYDSRLAQVFSNLIDNAVSFSPDAGTVLVRLVTTPENLEVKVIDEGRGIHGDSDKIFKRFYTDRPETENFGDHSGLGLSISRQIVEAHLGTIKAANRTDRSGAVFSVVLPRVRRGRG
jgi:two-component system sensor histidine kinase ChvG